MQNMVLDQLGREVNVKPHQSKIISLVPSITEMLYHLGLSKQVKGVTKFCIYPVQKNKEVQIVGGTKKFRMDVIRQIGPDIIFANKEENYKEGIEELEKDFPVWVSNPNTIEEAMDMISAIGKIVNKGEASNDLILQIRNEWKEVRAAYSQKVLYLIWNEPMMAVGSNTYIDSVLGHLGFINCLGSYDRYPPLSERMLMDLNPDLVFLSSEPFPFKEKHIPKYKELFPNATVMLVDGEMFSWYGSRMLCSPKYFKSLGINPE